MAASIEYIERMIATFGEAAAANRATPGRRGSIVELDAQIAEDVMITADLHGHRVNFNAILKRAALDEHPRRHLVLQEVCHGGPAYPNGGCMSHTLVEDIAKLKVKYPDRVHFLLGNHEMAEVMDYPIVKAKKMLNLLFRQGMQETFGPATDMVRKALCQFFKTCPVAMRLPGDVVILHSLADEVDRQPVDVSVLSRDLRDDDFQPLSDLFRILWGRDYRPENAKKFAALIGAKVLIHGHDPCPEGFKTPNDLQIILDCCSSPATYVILPLSRELTQTDVVERIETLA